MTYEADRDIKTMLALLELEGLGGATDGSTSEGKWFPDTRAYLEKLAQSRRDKASLVAEVAGLKQTVEKVEKERNDALAQAYKAGVERDNALAEVAQLKAARDKERDMKVKAAQAAWDKEVAATRAERAASLRAEAAEKARVLREQNVREEVEKAREEVEKRRQEALVAAQAERSRTRTAAEKLAALRARRQREYRGARHTYTASVPDPADDLLEAELVAEVAAEEREKIRVEAKAQAERSRPETEDRRSEIERARDAYEKSKWG
jgi:hypothetical protein